MIGGVSAPYAPPTIPDERPNEIAVRAWLAVTTPGASKASPPPPPPPKRWDNPFSHDFWRWQRPQQHNPQEDLELAPPPRPFEPALASYTLTPGRLTQRGTPLLSMTQFASADPRKGVTFSVLV